MKHWNNPRVGTCALTLALIACGGTESAETGAPPRVAVSSQQAALTARENTEAALRGILDAGGFLAESATIADTLQVAFGGSSECASEVAPCPVGEPCDVPVVTTCEDDPISVTDLEESRQELHDALDELVGFLRDEVFIEANLESDDGTYSVYKLPQSLFCGADDPQDTGLGTTDGAPAEAVAPSEVSDATGDDCEVDYATLQPRLRLSSPATGDVDVDVLLTEDKTNPLSFQLYEDRIGATWDLGELKATLDSVGQELEGLSTLDGKTGIELVRLGSLHYALRTSVLEDLHVVAGDPTEQVEVLVAASNPVFEFEVDGNAKTISGAIDYGAINLVAPLSMFMGDAEQYDDAGNPLPPKQYTGMIDAVLGGLEASLTFDGTRDSLTVGGVGLGDVTSSVMHDGNPLLGLDLNPSAGRHFDVHIESTGDSSGTLAFSPTLDVNLAMNFAQLQDQIDDIPGFMLDDTIRLWFEGEEPTIELGEEQLRVVSGTLHLDSAAEPSTSLSVEAGMCLAEAPESESEPASLAAGFVAATCE